MHYNLVKNILVFYKLVYFFEQYDVLCYNIFEVSFKIITVNINNTLELRKRQNNCLILFMWIADNLQLLSSYDYIIVDTHNDSSLVTSNFISIADSVIGVAESYLITNKIEYIGNTSKEFLAAVSEEKVHLGQFSSIFFVLMVNLKTLRNIVISAFLRVYIIR